MNGVNEQELALKEKTVIEALTGLNVDVVAGKLLGDTFVRPLTKEGAQTVLDRLRGRGFKIERV